jgi:DNA replication and repair protein RecF
MILRKIELNAFRSYQKSTFELGEKVNMVYGANASGKTNLLEAVFLLSTGESFRARKTEDMVGFEAEYASVVGEVLGNSGDRLEIVLTRGQLMGRRVNKKKFIVSDVSRRKGDYLDRGFRAVIFRPEDMDLLVGSSDGRRRMLDLAISQVIGGYERSLGLYFQALKRRNKLLDAIREGKASRHSLTFWNGVLVKHGEIIIDGRSDFAKYINDLWSKSELFNSLRVEYQKNLISEQRLEEHADAELAVGYTLVGPHKDDLRVMKSGEKDMADFGSRGEQRMAVLALKVAELYYLDDDNQDGAILLLDDIFSELDEKHKREVLRVMKGRQVIVSSAVLEDQELMSREFGSGLLNIIKL